MAAERREKRARSMANLRMFAPGQSGNPAGRKPGGAFVEEALSSLLSVNADGSPHYSEEEIRAMAMDANTPPAWKAAAHRVLLVIRDPSKFIKDRRGNVRYAGADPECGKAFAQIMDRLVGKPVQTVHATHQTIKSPEQIHAEIVAMLSKSPAMVRLMEQFLSRRSPELIEQPPSHPALAHGPDQASPATTQQPFVTPNAAASS